MFMYFTLVPYVKLNVSHRAGSPTHALVNDKSEDQAAPPARHLSTVFE